MKPIKVNNYFEVYNNNIKTELKGVYHFLDNLTNGSNGVTRIINAHDNGECQYPFDISSLPEDVNLVWSCKNFQVFKHEYWEGENFESELFFLDLYVFVEKKPSPLDNQIAENIGKIKEQLEKGEDIQLSYQKSRNRLHIKQIRVKNI